MILRKMFSCFLHAYPPIKIHTLNNKTLRKIILCSYVKPCVYDNKTFSGNYCKIPYFIIAVAAGFPSPAEGHVERSLDLNEYLIDSPASTFYVRVIGDSMIGVGIHEKDLLIVDKSLEAKHGSIIIAVVNGEFTVKRLAVNKIGIFLVPENPKYSAIHVTSETDFQIWGVVTNVIHSLR